MVQVLAEALPLALPDGGPCLWRSDAVVSLSFQMPRLSLPIVLTRVIDRLNTSFLDIVVETVDRAVPIVMSMVIV